MVSSNLTAGAVGQLFTAQEDRYLFNANVGGYGFKREKREGRNPATGARTSRRYGLSITHATGMAPLSKTYDNQPLY